MEELFETRNGVMVPRISPQWWEELRTYTLRPDDVFIATYPKSGTTWMQQIVKLLRSDGRMDGIKIDRSVPWLEMLDSSFGKIMGYTTDMATSSEVISPRAFKSHFTYELIPGGLPHTTPAKYIYVMRNPKDICVSSWHHVHKNSTSPSRLSWDEHMELILNFRDVPFGDWFSHVLGWWKHRDAPNILFVKYEDMKADPLAIVSTVAKFIGISNITDQLLQDVVEKSSFASMKKDASANYNWMAGPDKALPAKDQFIRKGEIGSWIEHFSEEQNRRFDEIYAERMMGSDLDFKFD